MLLERVLVLAVGTIIFCIIQGTQAETKCSDKYAVFPQHSACLHKSTKYKNGGVNSAAISLILSEHNKLRATMNATNMETMYWDDDLAVIAQGWADNCDFEHDSGQARGVPGKYTAGQNLGSGYSSWGSCIQAWYDEIHLFTYGDKDMDFLKVGHFTQLVWGSSSRIGCGFSSCENYNKFYVCNYGPAGNMGSWFKPYQPGGKCANCINHCLNELCDCGETPCLNSGTRNLTTCQCQCKTNALSKEPLEFYVGDSCSLNCSAVIDPGYCDSQYHPESCPKYNNVPAECPEMCRVCPWSGINYVEGSVPLPASTNPVRSHHVITLLMFIISVYH